jgi:hypothetical protein
VSLVYCLADHNLSVNASFVVVFNAHESRFMTKSAGCDTPSNPLSGLRVLSCLRMLPIPTDLQQRPLLLKRKSPTKSSFIQSTGSDPLQRKKKGKLNSVIHCVYDNIILNPVVGWPGNLPRRSGLRFLTMPSYFSL